MNIGNRIELMKERLNGIHDVDNCTVTVKFTDGTIAKVPFYGGLVGQFTEDGELIETEIERRGWTGEVAEIECDQWKFMPMCEIMEALWRRDN